MLVNRSTPVFAVTPDALGAELITAEGEKTTARQLLEHRSKSIGPYNRHAHTRDMTNVLVQPSSTHEQFSATHGHDGILFDSSTDHADPRRLIDTMTAFKVGHFVTADPTLAAHAKNSNIKTSLVEKPKLNASRTSTDSELSAESRFSDKRLYSDSSLESNRSDLQSGSSMTSINTDVPRTHSPIKIAFTPGSFDIADDKYLHANAAATSTRLLNTARLLARHAAQHHVALEHTGNEARQYHTSLVSNSQTHLSEADAHAQTNELAIPFDARKHHASQSEMLDALASEPPHIFITSDFSLAKKALERGILAGSPTQSALFGLKENAVKDLLTWVFDFDGVTADRKLESAVKYLEGVDPKNGHGIALANESKIGHLPCQPGPALGLLRALSNISKSAISNSDRTEILTSRPHPAAGTVHTSRQHFGLSETGVTTVADGSKGDQLRLMNGVLLDDSENKVESVRETGKPAILLPTLPDHGYNVFKKFGNENPQAAA